MKICGFNKTTLLDYPGRVACTIFLGGCNLRCPFCQNGALVMEADTQPGYSQDEILAFLKKEREFWTVYACPERTDAFCRTSGFLHEIKNLGYDVKLDTKGHVPLW